MEAQKQPDPELRKLYPELSDEELILAEEKLTEYLTFALRLHRRISGDPDAYRKFQILTDRKHDRTIDPERSSNDDDSAPT